jgi:hypothetical protein
MTKLDSRLRNLITNQIPDKSIVNEQELLSGVNPFGTNLKPEAEKEFASFAKNIQQLPTPDFDLRGLFKEAKGKGLVDKILGGQETELGGINPTTQTFHFTDKFKTPFHKSFSRESQFATKDAPRWVQNEDQSFRLVDANNKTLIDERDEAKLEQQPFVPSEVDKLLAGIKIKDLSRKL